MNDNRVLGAKSSQHIGHGVMQLTLSDAQELSLGAGRIAERTEQIEDRGKAEFFPHWRDVFHRGVEVRGEAKANAKLVETALHDRHGRFNIYTERRQHVGRSAFARNAPIAMLSHGHTGRRHHNGCCSADIEQVAANSAGTARIDQVCMLRANRRHMPTHRAGCPRDLLGCFPLVP